MSPFSEMQAKSGWAANGLIPSSDVAISILQRQQARGGQTYSHAFPSRRRPGRVTGDVIGAWERVKLAAGLAPDLRIHNLRYLFALALANAGVGLFEIGTVLGHT